MQTVKAFVQLTRPVFLLGGALLFGLGAALADDPVVWSNYALGQAMVTTIQLAAQYANEYFDVEADRLAGQHRTWLTGGSGVLADGRLAPATALRAAWIATTAALALMVAVAGINGWAALTGLLALVGSWLYSSPPIRLVATRLGVAAASVIVAVLTPLVGLLVRGSAPDDRFVSVALPLLLLHGAMLIAFERPDVTGDSAAGKPTLSVRLGPTASARLHGAFIGVAYATLLLATTLGPLDWNETAWALALAPFGLMQAGGFNRAPDAILVTAALGLFGGTAFALLIGLA